MAEPLDVTGKDLSRSRFTRSDLAGTVFDDLNLSGTTFNNINLRGARFSAVDFGGARFSCMNTGEGRPRQPAVFTNVELHGCIFEGGSFAHVEISGADVDGMKIGGVLVTDMMKAYQAGRTGP
jgi:uncharacterized protein YjbI with pentapeptide repeats